MPYLLVVHFSPSETVHFHLSKQVHPLVVTVYFKNCPLLSEGSTSTQNLSPSFQLFTTIHPKLSTYICPNLNFFPFILSIKIVHFCLKLSPFINSCQFLFKTLNFSPKDHFYPKLSASFKSSTSNQKLSHLSTPPPPPPQSTHPNFLLPTYRPVYYCPPSVASQGFIHQLVTFPACQLLTFASCPPLCPIFSLNWIL